MADTMQFDLVSPERSLASFAATAVQLPGSEGDMTAMPNHAPTITTLRPGKMTVTGEDGTVDFIVTGGFAEITGRATTVLAERAYPMGDEARKELERILEETRAKAETATGDELDFIQRLIADFIKLLEAME